MPSPGHGPDCVERPTVAGHLERSAQPRAGGHGEVDALVGDDPAERQVEVRWCPRQSQEVIDVDRRVDDLDERP